MFKVRDRVRATRDIKAGLGEDGPEVCKAGTRGIVVEIETNEPDGVCVMLGNNTTWWFKPNQLESCNE